MQRNFRKVLKIGTLFANLNTTKWHNLMHTKNRSDIKILRDCE